MLRIFLGCAITLLMLGGCRADEAIVDTSGIVWRAGGVKLLPVAPTVFVISCAHGSIRINVEDGKVTQDNCALDEGAKAFWKAVEAMAPMNKTADANCYTDCATGSIICGNPNVGGMNKGTQK